MNYEEAMRIVMAARPRTVETAGLKVRKMVQLTDRVPTLWAAVITEGLMIHATRYREDIKIEIRSGDDVHLRRMFRAEDKRDMAELAELTLADWKTDHPTVTIDPTDDAVDELELAVSEVAEALAAEVDRLRAEVEFLREESEVSIATAQYLAAMIADPDGGLADAVWRALGDGARERVEMLLKAARDAVGGEK